MIDQMIISVVPYINLAYLALAVGFLAGYLIGGRYKIVRREW